MVNTTASSLNLANGAVSKLILSTAGPQIQAECHQLAPKGVALGHVVETAGYGLPCRRVYHGACQAWNNGSGACEATLRKFMKKVFRQANAAGSYTSIAIPAIGTGNLHIPAPLAAKWMYDEAEKFSRKKNPKRRCATFPSWSTTGIHRLLRRSSLNYRAGRRPVMERRHAVTVGILRKLTVDRLSMLTMVLSPSVSMVDG